MVNFLRKKFITDYQNVKNQKVREAHGKLASFFGIFTNLFLFLIKLVIGILTFSISIIADSINNFSDMASSVVSLLGFKLSNMPADSEHPFGHERMEYIAGFLVAIVVCFVGVALGYNSVIKIIDYTFTPPNITFTIISMGILVLSIILKLVQANFNKKIGKLISSTTLLATAVDSRNDVIGTSAVLIGTLVNTILFLFGIELGFSLDGILGLLVSMFIIVSGIMLIKETANPLIGENLPKETVFEIINYVKSNPFILDIHDLACHMYGPTKCLMTLHAEVDADKDFIETHDAIDNIEKDVKDKYNVELTIHMDPVELNNEYNDFLMKKVTEYISQLDKCLKFHDFRVVRKLSRSTILFDVVVPFDCKLTHKEIEEFLQSKADNDNLDCALLITFDKEYFAH